MKANELKKGMVLQAGNQDVVVKHLQVQSPSSRSGSTLYKVRGRDIATGQKFERRYKGDEIITTIDLSRCSVQLLYRDGDGCTFMDTESYEQYTLPDAAVEEELPFLTDDMKGLVALVSDGKLLGIELPTSVVLEIKECAPGMRAASSSARTKPATLNTDLVIQVPEYLEPGNKIKVNTETREFISRA